MRWVNRSQIASDSQLAHPTTNHDDSVIPPFGTFRQYVPQVLPHPHSSSRAHCHPVKFKVQNSHLRLGNREFNLNRSFKGASGELKCGLTSTQCGFGIDRCVCDGSPKRTHIAGYTNCKPPRAKGRGELTRTEGLTLCRRFIHTVPDNSGFGGKNNKGPFGYHWRWPRLKTAQGTPHRKQLLTSHGELVAAFGLCPKSHSSR